MTEKLFKFYVVLGIFGFWGTMSDYFMVDIVCVIIMLINCILYLKGEHND